MRRRTRWLPCLLALLAGCGEHRAPANGAALRLADLLGRDDAGFARATRPIELAFPRDHGPHPEFRNEWWYFTGNLAGRDGRRFGFQLTFFRTALTPAPAVRPSAWATSQVWMAHFALTDVAGGQMRAFERFGRGALGLAGARAAPFAVWLEDWSAEGEAGTFTPMRLRAAEDDVAIDLRLRPGKPRVLQGDRGLSTKGADGQASYYYSYTRLPATGSVRIDGAEHQVEGTAWCDREWSTSALGEDQVGWDWFALQLDDGSDVMFYAMRRRDGTTDPASRGVVVAPDGSATPLHADDVDVQVTSSWSSDDGGARYPAGFALRGPDFALRVTPALADQELRLAVRYWEGAVVVDGERRGAAVRGRGYVELTGYRTAGR